MPAARTVQVQPVKADQSYLTELERGEIRKGSARGQPKERRETKPRTAAPVSFRSFGSPSHPWKQSNVNQSNQSKLKTRNSPALSQFIRFTWFTAVWYLYFYSDCLRPLNRFLSFHCLRGSGDEHQRGKRDGSLGAHSPPFPLGFLPRTPFFLTPIPPVPSDLP